MSVMQYNKDEIKNSLTIDQVFEIVQSFGGDPIMKEDFFISKTICHNYFGEGSYKLYYYDNTKLFRCYTDCGDTFDIFELVCKVQNLNGKFKQYNNEGESLYREWQLFDAINFVIKFFNLSFDNSFSENNYNVLLDWKILSRYEDLSEKYESQIVELKIYDDNILKNLPTPRIIPWENEGISKEVMSHHNICYNPQSQAIIIPHYNINNQLIGIRERTLIKDEEKYGKYKPAILNYKMYNHPLGFNLYNLNNSKEQIKVIKKAIIGEGEKFCLMYASYFGEDNDISVACCGSSLTSYQIQLLLSLGVEEIIIAFDKQFKEIGDDEFKRWTKKLINIHKKYSSYATISFMFDKYNLLEYKDSPIDKDKNTFLELFNRRFSL